MGAIQVLPALGGIRLNRPRARHGLAPTFEVPVILERHLKPAANLEHQAVFGLPAKLWAQAFAVKFEVDL